MDLGLVVAVLRIGRLCRGQESPRGRIGIVRTSNRGLRSGRAARHARRLPDALKFANGLLRQKKYDLAAEEYERFVSSGAKGPDLDDARFGLATARLYQGNFPEARGAFDEFPEGCP